MKILVVGSDSVEALENFYVNNLRANKLDVEVYPAHSLYLEYLNKGLLNKVLFNIGFSTIFRKINRELILLTEKVKPDIIIVFKGMEIFPETLQIFKNMGIKLVNINPDNPFLFTGKGSGNKNITLGIEKYDLHITYSKSILKELIDKGHNAALIPFACEISENDYKASEAQEEIVKVCFLGNPDKERAAQISDIAEKFPIDVFGNNWKRYLQHRNVTIHESVYKADLWKILRRYRVQLNLLRIHNLDAHNMRSFEIAGIGGIQLAPDTAEHRFYFEDKKEIFLYKNRDEQLELINELLKMPKDKVMQIRNAAKSKTINEDYTYRHRTAQLIDLLAKLNG